MMHPPNLVQTLLRWHYCEMTLFWACQTTLELLCCQTWVPKLSWRTSNVVSTFSRQLNQPTIPLPAETLNFPLASLTTQFRMFEEYQTNIPKYCHSLWGLPRKPNGLASHITVTFAPLLAKVATSHLLTRCERSWWTNARIHLTGVSTCLVQTQPRGASPSPSVLIAAYNCCKNGRQVWMTVAMFIALPTYDRSSLQDTTLEDKMRNEKNFKF